MVPKCSYTSGVDVQADANPIDIRILIEICTTRETGFSLPISSSLKIPA